LSPASSSFDAFANYEERGEEFEKIVNSLESEKGENDCIDEVCEIGE